MAYHPWEEWVTELSSREDQALNYYLDAWYVVPRSLC